MLIFPPGWRAVLYALIGAVLLAFGITSLVLDSNLTPGSFIAGLGIFTLIASARRWQS